MNNMVNYLTIKGINAQAKVANSKKISDYLKFAVFLLPLLLLKVNPTIDIAVFFLTVLFLVFNINNNRFLLFFFVLTIFGDAFEFNVIDGSFSRVYQVLFLIRTFLFIYKERRAINITSSVLITVFFVVSSVFYTHSIGDLLSNAINCFVLLYIGQEILRQPGKIIEEIFCVIAFGAIFSGIYGAVHGYFMFDRGMVRMFGTIKDPNYSCFIYLLGLSSALAIKKMPPLLKTVLCSFLFVLVVLSVSISGIVGFCFVLLLFFLLTKNKKLLLFVAASFLTLVLVFVFGVVFPESAFGSLIGRIGNVITEVAYGDYAGATSLRTTIANWYLSYFLNLPAKNVFFGGINTVSGETREYFVSAFYNVSHNSFIDMLYMIGAFGTLLFVIYFVRKLFLTATHSLKYKDLHALGMFLLLSVCIFYMFSISIFPYRFFYVFALLEYGFQKRAGNLKNTFLIGASGHENTMVNE